MILSCLPTHAVHRSFLPIAANYWLQALWHHSLAFRFDAGAGGLCGIALSQLTSADCIDVVKVLLDLGADIEAADFSKATALLRAASNGHTEVLRVLLDKGAVEQQLR